jgi:imidazoleglycerol phosphate dehydratase HisB
VSQRVSTIDRRTRETEIVGELSLDGAGKVTVATGIGFLDHLMSTFAYHAGFDLRLECSGDLDVDDHHTAEDCALAIGAALDDALGQRGGIARFGWAYTPLDEALARAVVDLSGRPWAEISLGLERDSIGRLACENVEHVLTSLATAARCALHVDLLRGRNDHHRSEAAFKATALAMRQAVALTGHGHVPSTKGVLV